MTRKRLVALTAAGLTRYARPGIPKFLINSDEMNIPQGFAHIQLPATSGMKLLAQRLAR